MLYVVSYLTDPDNFKISLNTLSSRPPVTDQLVVYVVDVLVVVLISAPGTRSTQGVICFTCHSSIVGTPEGVWC